MTPLPHDHSPDSTLALLREGYLFISNRCRRYGSDAFETRLTLTPAVCAQGEEWARLFYAPDRFTRRSANLGSAVKLLQDFGSVQALDAAQHHWRKQMFLSLVRPDSVARLADAVEECWRTQMASWQTMARVALFPAVQEILCRAVCRWAGIPLAEAEAQERTREFAAMIDGAGAVGPRNWRGLLLRRRTERWARDLIRMQRDGTLDAGEGRALSVIALWRDADNALLDPAAAVVELINVLRPTVAIANYVTFAALALHQYPATRSWLLESDDRLEPFAQEVRRFYPFFPFIGGRALEPFEWHGHRFDRGTWVLLDLYGTDHDPRLWPDGNTFHPERFLERRPEAFDLIPQGGGDVALTHRCPGEGITIEVTKRALSLLTRAMRYRVPPQDLQIDLSRIPALPRSRFVIEGVEHVA